MTELSKCLNNVPGPLPSSAADLSAAQTCLVSFINFVPDGCILNADLNRVFNALLPGSSTESCTSRRTLLKVALGVGYAAAAMPITAQTAIKTPDEGLKSGQTSFEVNGFTVPAFYAALKVKLGCRSCW